MVVENLNHIHAHSQNTSKTKRSVCLLHWTSITCHIMCVIETRRKSITKASGGTSWRNYKIKVGLIHSYYYKIQCQKILMYFQALFLYIFSFYTIGFTFLAFFYHAWTINLFWGLFFKGCVGHYWEWWRGSSWDQNPWLIQEGICIQLWYDFHEL